MTTALDFSDYIADRTRDFVGREWVFAEIDRWLADPDAPRFFVITGEPGIGKTAIVARLTQIRDLDAHHFCIARQASTIDPLEFVRSLSHQLTRIDGFAHGILRDSGIHIDARQDIRVVHGQAINVQIEYLTVNAPSAISALNRSVNDPLQALYAGGFERLLVILVDALDEAVQFRGAESIVDLLANTGSLPHQVRFVLTSRPEGKALRHFERLNIPHLLLEAGGPENQADVQAYVRYRLDQSERLQLRLVEEAVEADTFVERVIEASRGNFLYLFWLLRSVEEGTQLFDTLEALPEGLDGIYREFLRTRALGKDIHAWREWYRPLLGMLTAAQVFLTWEQLVGFTELGKQTVKDVLDDIRQFLDPISARENQYRLYHQSVIDFLGDESRAGEFWIDLGAIHRRIVGYYRDHCGDFWSGCDEYGLRYLPTHLVEAGDWEHVRVLLSNLYFLEAKIRALSIHELELDYRSALADWQGSREDREVLQAFEECLRLESHHIKRAPELLFPQLYNHLTWLDGPEGPLHTWCENARMGRIGWLRLIRDRHRAQPPGSFAEEGHKDIVTAVAATPDGVYVVSASKDETIKVWNRETGQLLHSLEGHTGGVNTVVVSLSGTQVISGGR